MARLLIRSGKDPFTPVVAESTLAQDVFNSNSGNYLFQHAVWKSLATDDAELVSNGTLSERDDPADGDAERINEEFDHFVIPLANAFRSDFIGRLDRLSALLEGITIPVTVVGVGAQAGTDLSRDGLASVEDNVRRFVGLVLDRSASIGVRGEFTRDYLVGLGFPSDAVDIIGCPSLFLHGRDFTVEKRVDTITADSPLALNLTPEVPGIGAFATAQAARHPQLTYIGQDAHDLRLLLWGVPFPHVHDPLAPVHLQHPLYQTDRMRLFLDMWTWYDFLQAKDFAYGTRFHGNVAALLAGTPAMLLAHDSRTLELAEYHRMPYQLMPELSGDIRAKELFDATDLTEFNRATPECFDRYTAFLERNGLAHIWTGGNGSGDFDKRLAEASFPPAVRPLVASDGGEVAARLKWLRDGMGFDGQQHAQAYKHPFPHPPRRDAGTRRRAAEQATKDRLAAQKQEIAELRAALRRVENRTLIGFIRRVFRVLRRTLRRS